MWKLGWTHVGAVVDSCGSCGGMRRGCWGGTSVQRRGTVVVGFRLVCMRAAWEVWTDHVQGACGGGLVTPTGDSSSDGNGRSWRHGAPRLLTAGGPFPWNSGVDRAQCERDRRGRLNSGSS